MIIFSVLSLWIPLYDALATVLMCDQPTHTHVISASAMILCFLYRFRIVVWVFLVTDGAASGLVYVYLRLLRKCTPAEVEQLRDPDTPWQSGFFPLAVPVTPSTLTY